MSKLNMYTDTKKALFINNKRVTEYIFDEIIETQNESILYSDTVINIYDKSTGEKLFEHLFEDECEILRVTTDFFYIEKNDKAWLYTTRGKSFSKEPFDDFCIPENYESLRCIIVNRGNKKGVYSFDGAKLVACEYDSINLCKNAIEAYIKEKDTIVHVYSLKGLLIFSAIMWEDQWWTTPAGIVKQNPKGKQGLYSLDAKVILPESYDEIEISDLFEFNKLECIKVKKGDRYGLYDFYGREILPIEFDGLWISERIPHSSMDYIMVKKDDKYGIYSSDGTLQVPIEYEYLKSYRKGSTCNGCKNGAWGYYIIPKKQFVIADEINITKTGKYEILVNGKWQMINLI